MRVFVYVCVCGGMCVCEREKRQREKEGRRIKYNKHNISPTIVLHFCLLLYLGSLRSDAEDADHRVTQ